MFPVNNNTYSTRQNDNHSVGISTSSQGSISQTRSMPLSTEDYHALWAEWENNAPPGAGEERDVAVFRMRECLANNRPSLNLADLKLSSLPEWLPEKIKELKVYRNQLSKLPDNLPITLTKINASGNVITEIPRKLPPELNELFLEENQIEIIPENLPDSINALALGDNEIVSLPNHLPNNLESLEVEMNYLSSIPNNLPDSITFLNLNKNRITALPDHLPNNLQTLKLVNNHLETIPNTLPDNICFLYLTGNRLSSLPNHLPNELRVLDLRDNQLQTLPASIVELSRNVIIEAEYNPFLARTLHDLIELNQAPNDIGPQISFSMSAGHSDVPPPPLIESVQAWLSAPLSEGAAAQWVVMGQEAGAEAFSAFLSRLSQTRNARENPVFQEKVSDWLNLVAENPALRQTAFAVALGATASCEDRVTLTWNDMQKLALTHQVEHGLWDNELPELMASGCEMFRLEQLEQAARDKVKTLRFVDEIEVYLAYQTGLKEALKLSSVGDMMRFADVSGVTQEDLNRTLIEVKTRENREFPTWLSQWSPWKTALQRANPDLIQHLQAQNEAIIDSFPQRLEAAIQASGLAGIEGVEVTIGKQIWNEIQRESDIELTRAFLKARYQALLTDNTPFQALTAVSELVSVASLAPTIAAMAIRPERVGEEHPSSLLAARVAEGGMTQLAEAWISLLRLLYQDRSLSKAEILSVLLPHKIQDRVKSLAHAVAGAAWNSEATTKMSALLSEVARSDEGIRREIMTRLALEQHGYGFRQRKLDQPADFYKRAKYADNFSPNDTAKALLRQEKLIPENRELFNMASDVPSEAVIQPTDNPATGFAILEEKIKQVITPQLLAARAAWERERTELERAKKSLMERLGEFNAQAKEAKKKTR